VLAARQSEPDYRAGDDGTVPIRRLLGRNGKVRPSRRFDTIARDERIGSLRADGLTVRAIATEVGCSVGTVHRVLKSVRYQHYWPKGREIHLRKNSQ
jgi:DNA invertase Pin-like site-specific DNA recombinase